MPRLFAVVEWGGRWSVVALDLQVPTEIVSGEVVADCTDEQDAHRIARLLADDERERCDVSLEEGS